jgi:tRNA modification GTPase
MTRPTIFARATGALPSAIAIMRVSGPAAAPAVEALTGRACPPPRHAVVRTFRDANGALLDSALLLWFPGPDTATGEDLAELHLHGSRAVLSGVEAALAALPGLRAAEAGEFTMRAFENGRIDLSQVEGLADLLAAETARQRVAALTMSEGGLRRRVEDWQVRLLDLAARAEASIDHDDEADVDAGPLSADTAALAADIRAALADPPAERLRDGIRIGIAGPPNAGKSSLINVLSGRDAAIVSDIAGTTRDLVEVPVVIDGIAMILTDMAGLRDEAGDEIEAIGIDRARDAAARSDILVWLGDPAGAPVHSARIDVAAKSDLGVMRCHDIAVSALTGDGIDDLRRLLATRATPLLPTAGSLALSEGQRAHLLTVAKALDASRTAPEVILTAEHFRTARLALDRITGRADTEAMLDALFGRFCIGK